MATKSDSFTISRSTVMIILAMLGSAWGGYSFRGESDVPTLIQPEGLVNKPKVCFRARLIRRDRAYQRDMWVAADWDVVAQRWTSSDAYEYLPAGRAMTTLDALSGAGGWTMQRQYLRAFDRNMNYIGEWYIGLTPGQIGQPPKVGQPPAGSNPIGAAPASRSAYRARIPTVVCGACPGPARHAHVPFRK